MADAAEKDTGAIGLVMVVCFVKGDVEKLDGLGAEVIQEVVMLDHDVLS